MIIYHGSSIEVNKPDIFHSGDNVDFGKGFYITPLQEQAAKWATRFKLRHPELLDEYDRNDSIFITRNREGITTENLCNIIKRNDIKKNQFYIMLSLLNEGAITMDDLEEFSDDLKDTIGQFTGR